MMIDKQTAHRAYSNLNQRRKENLNASYKFVAEKSIIITVSL